MERRSNEIIPADDNPRADEEMEDSWSLSSSIIEYVYENGRHYHRKSADQYVMPSDAEEQDRLDLMHHLQLLLLGGELHKAPIVGDPPRVLDCGTGTGVWALDFGLVHEKSKVFGVDLAPIQPGWTYENVFFETDDLEKTPWTFPENYFNFVHCRHIRLGLHNWEEFIGNVFKHTAPGGYFELSEHNVDSVYCDDGTTPPKSAWHRYTSIVGDQLRAVGIDPSLAGKDFQRMMQEAGFEDVRLYTYKVPWGSWPKHMADKRIGAIMGEVLKSGIEALGLSTITRAGQMSEDDTQRLCEEAIQLIYAGKQHGYSWQWQIVGQKPEKA